MKLSELYVGGEPQIVVALKKITDDKRRVYCKIGSEGTGIEDDAEVKKLLTEATGFNIVSRTDSTKDLLNVGSLINFKMLKKSEPVKEKTIEGQKGVFMRLTKDVLDEVVRENFKALAEYFGKTIGSDDGLEEAVADPFRSRALLKRMVCENQGIYVAEKNADGEYRVNTFDEWLDITKVSLADDCGGYVYELMVVYAYKRDEKTAEFMKSVDMLAKGSHEDEGEDRYTLEVDEDDEDEYDEDCDDDCEEDDETEEDES